jgi:protein-S-isoprenylcysteine O-methyltransferase Ste14
VTLVMFPILVVTYLRLARREEREVRAQFGETWDTYASRTPAFIPQLGRHGQIPTRA